MKFVKLIMAVALPLAVVACSLTPVSSRVAGYLTTPKGELLVSQDGQCWRTAEWRPALAIRRCDPEVVKQQEKLKAEEEKVEEVAEEKTDDQLPEKSHEGREHAGSVYTPPATQTPEAIAEIAKKEEVKMRTETLFAPLTLNSDTSFRFGDDRLTADGRDAVIEMAGILKRRKVQDMRLTVVGHTDRIGSDKANKDLSRRRAEAVKKALIAEGIPAETIETGGMGSTMPITTLEDCPNDLVHCELIDCLRPDRRVDIKVKGKVESGTRAVPVNGLLELKLPARPAANISERRAEMASVCKAG